MSYVAPGPEDAAYVRVSLVRSSIPERFNLARHRFPTQGNMIYTPLWSASVLHQCQSSCLVLVAHLRLIRKGLLEIHKVIHTKPAVPLEQRH